MSANRCSSSVRAAILALGSVLFLSTSPATAEEAPPAAPMASPGAVPTFERPREPEVAPASVPPMRSQACDNWIHPGLPDGPISIGLYHADLGTGRRACPRSEFSLYSRAALAIDKPNFYGNVAVDGLLHISHVINQRAEIFGTVEFLHWQYAQNATLKGSEASFGNVTLGVSAPALQTRRWVLSPYLKLMLPTAGPGTNVLTLGGEAGVAVTYRPLNWVELHGYAGYDYSVGLSAAPPVSRNAANLGVGLEIAPRSYFGLVVDLHAHFGARAAVDYFAALAAFRFRLWRNLGLELAGMLPAVGKDRRDGALLLRLTYRY